MARKTTTIKVEDIEGNKYEVDLKEELSWGEQQEIEEVIQEGAKYQMKGKPGNLDEQEVETSFDNSAITESKYVTLRVVIDEIRDEDGESQQFSKEWANKLTRTDGDKLYNKVDEMTAAKKKT